jgi:hypothetical protein
MKLDLWRCVEVEPHSKTKMEIYNKYRQIFIISEFVSSNLEALKKNKNH